MDRSPLWGDRLNSGKAGPWRYLVAPLLLYQLVCYTWRWAVTGWLTNPLASQFEWLAGPTARL